MTSKIEGDRYGGAVRFQDNITSNARPYIVATNYFGCTVRRVGFSKPFPFNPAWNPSWYYPDLLNSTGNYYAQSGYAPPSVVNKALTKLYDQMEQAESLRVAWLERQKALDMIASATRTIIRIAKAVKRRDPRIVRAIIGRNPSKRDILTTPSSIWLGYWFGIVPTVSDLHHAAQIFAYDPPALKLSVASGGEAKYGDAWINCVVKLTGQLTAFDPNVSLASRLGFGQPLSTLYEMTMCSWVLDYFVNVGELLKNLEPRFPGLSFSNAATTKFYQYNGGTSYSQNDYFYYSGVGLKRQKGWPSYQLAFPIVDGLKAKQASYLVAVAIQLISSIMKK